MTKFSWLLLSALLTLLIASGVNSESSPVPPGQTVPDSADTEASDPNGKSVKL